MVYILYLNTVFYDFDTHYDDHVIGVFSSEEKAKKAYEKFLGDYLDEDGNLDWPMADDWSFNITVYKLDDDDNLDNGYVVARLKSNAEWEWE